jgi:hypothetical protein
LTSQGKSAIDAIRSIGVTDAPYYRWRQEYGGLKVDQVKRMKWQAPDGWSTSYIVNPVVLNLSPCKGASKKSENGPCKS